MTGAAGVLVRVAKSAPGVLRANWVTWALAFWRVRCSHWVVAHPRAATPSGRTMRCPVLMLLPQQVQRQLIGSHSVLVGCGPVRAASAAP